MFISDSEEEKRLWNVISGSYKKCGAKNEGFKAYF